MRLEAKFTESTERFRANFGEIKEIKDGYSQAEVDKMVSDAEGKGIEEGKQAENDAFWDMYQQNGERTDYNYAFAGEGWNDTTFQPKYDIAPTRAMHMFSGSRITDLVKALLDAGVTLDMSKMTSEGTYLIQSNSYTQTMPELNLTGLRNITYFLYGCSALRSIEKVVLKDDGSQKFNTYSFYQLPALEEIRFAGTIGNSLEIKGSPILSDASVQSIIDHLKDLTGATAQTLTLHSDVKVKMTEQQIQAVWDKNWELG